MKKLETILTQFKNGEISIKEAESIIIESSMNDDFFMNNCICGNIPKIQYDDSPNRYPGSIIVKCDKCGRRSISCAGIGDIGKMAIKCWNEGKIKEDSFPNIAKEIMPVTYEYWIAKIKKPCGQLYTDFGAPMCRKSFTCFLGNKNPDKKNCPEGMQMV